MATPHVAGVCALVKTIAPEAGHLKIRDLVPQSVEPTPTFAPIAIGSWGLADRVFRFALPVCGRT